jgi:hypothetical protein
MDSHDLVDALGVLIPIVAILSTFTFIIVAVWTDNRRKEREAFYKAETLRRISESSGQGAAAALAMLREDEYRKRLKSREGQKISGLINIGVGVGIVLGLSRLIGPKVAFCGLIPAFLGVAMLIYVYFLAAPIEEPPAPPAAGPFSN